MRLAVVFLLIMASLVGLVGCGDAGTAGPQPTPTVTAQPTTTTSPTSSAEQARAGDTVRVHYIGTLGNGTVFDTSRDPGREPLEFEVGSGSMISGFDSAVNGMHVGQVKTVTLPPDEAYGPYDEELVQEVPRESFSEGTVLEAGATVYDRNGWAYKVLEVTDTTVTLDANHRLAGKELTFEIELLEIL